MSCTQMDLLLYPADTLAKERVPFSPLHQARCSMFMPWTQTGGRALDSYYKRFGKKNREIAVGDMGVVYVSGPLWRAHRNFLSTLLINISPLPLDNGDVRFYYSNSWLARKLGYKHPDSASAALDEIVNRLQATLLQYKLHKGVKSPVLSSEWIEKTAIIKQSGIVNEDTVVAGVAPGARYIDVSGIYLQIFEEDLGLRTTPDTIEHIARIDNGLWQAVIELVLSQSDFFNCDIDTTLAKIGITKDIYGASYYDHRDKLINDEVSRKVVFEIFGIEMKMSRDRKQTVYLIEDDEYLRQRRNRLTDHTIEIEHAKRLGKKAALIEPYNGIRPKFWSSRPC